MDVALIFVIALLGSILFFTPSHLRRFANFPAAMFSALAIAIVVILAVAPESAFASSATLLNIPQSAWDEVNQLGAAIVLALGAVAWKWISAHSPLQSAQAQQVQHDLFDAILNRATQFGLSQATAAEKNVGSIDVGNAAVAAGANFIIAHAPDMAKRFGFDVTTDAGRAAIARMIAARLVDHGTDPTTLLMPAATRLAGVPGGPHTDPPTLTH